jgi:hypothetical protein
VFCKCQLIYPKSGRKTHPWRVVCPSRYVILVSVGAEGYSRDSTGAKFPRSHEIDREMVSYENQCKVAPVVTLLNPTDLRQPSHTRAAHFFIPWYYTKKRERWWRSAAQFPIIRAPQWNFLFSPNTSIPMHSLHN